MKKMYFYLIITLLSLNLLKAQGSTQLPIKNNKVTYHTGQKSENAEKETTQPSVSTKTGTVTNAQLASDTLNAITNLSHNQYVQVLSVYNDFYLQTPSLASVKNMEDKLKAILTTEQWKKALQGKLVDE